MSLKLMLQTDLNYQFIWCHIGAALLIIIMVTWGTQLSQWAQKLHLLAFQALFVKGSQLDESWP